MRPKSPKTDDDLAVRKEAILKLFDPPPGKTTFYDWVNKGKIVSARDLPGYFLLNATRVRAGMPEIDIQEYRRSMREQSDPHRDVQLCLIALLTLAPDLAYALPDVGYPETLDAEDEKRIIEMAVKFQPDLAEFSDDKDRIVFCNGALDAARMIYRQG